MPEASAFCAEVSQVQRRLLEEAAQPVLAQTAPGSTRAQLKPGLNAASPKDAGHLARAKSKAPGASHPTPSLWICEVEEQRQRPPFHAPLHQPHSGEDISPAMPQRAERGTVRCSERPSQHFSLALCATTEHLLFSMHKYWPAFIHVLVHYSLLNYTRAHRHVHFPIPAPSSFLHYDEHPKIWDGAGPSSHPAHS